MAPLVKSAVLTDLASELWVDHFRLDSSNGPSLHGSNSWSITKRTLRGGVSDGIDVVSIANGALSFEVIPTRGFGLWRGKYNGLPLGWQSPVKFPVHPKFIDQTFHNGMGWLGGFNEWICRCGLSSIGRPHTDHASGASHTLHGQIANLPAHFVEVEVRDVDDGILAVRGIIDETRFFGPQLRLETSIETAAGTNELIIVDRVTNLGSQSTELQLLFHSNFGLPFLGANSQLIASVSEIKPYDDLAAADIDNWSNFQKPVAGYAERSYFLKLAGDVENKTTALLRNEAADKGVSLSFCLNELPSFTLWKNTSAETDGYVTGLEPATNYPSYKPAGGQSNCGIRLEPQATYETTLRIAIHDCFENVAATEESIRQLQPPTLVIHREPIALR